MRFRLRGTYRGSAPRSESFCVKYDATGGNILQCCADGIVKIYSAKTGEFVHKFSPAGVSSGGAAASAVMSVRLLPTGTSRQLPAVFLTEGRAAKQGSRVSNKPASGGGSVALIGCADGHVCLWNVGTGKCVTTVQKADSSDNGALGVLAVEFSCDGSSFFTGGVSRCISVYNTETRQVSLQLGDQLTGPANRVFALRASPEEPNLLASGGWDSCIRIWDTRSGLMVRSLFGPFISGESLDMCGGIVVSGSARHTDQIQLWDVSTGKKMDQITIPGGPEDVPAIYCCQLSPGGRYIAAGGSWASHAWVFDARTGSVLGTLKHEKALYSTAFTQDSREVVFTGADGNLLVMQGADT
eukprot:NODE_1403_length_1550_cov_29.995336_g1264_i0.p1 GENE.NODE_1403_length_1550_cov_29.995336_g1264_i0~~NODE_1403_length_1550_cov_29.995336_g1264_i0.p1  ORF type:complete len:355 (-),score=46.48 NODE_1403_length_1550_cov_29.995336_g1264_i0:415-1479(-)